MHHKCFKQSRMVEVICSLQVIWLKDDVPIFNSTKFLDSSGVDASSVLLQHNIETDKDKGKYLINGLTQLLLKKKTFVQSIEQMSLKFV